MYSKSQEGRWLSAWLLFLVSSSLAVLKGLEYSGKESGCVCRVVLGGVCSLPSC